MTTALVVLTKKLASRLDMGDNDQELITTLKATAFRGAQVSDAQMTALMVVANQYCLNPWTKEIYAFPDKGGIVPVVGVDGWARIINNHDQFDGMEFDQTDESCTCRMYRKDRSRATAVTEYLSECKRPGAGPWTSHPKRMLRHKAMIQCARLAFGYVGIYDEDEAKRIVEKDMGAAEVVADRTATVRDLLKAKPAVTIQAVKESFRAATDPKSLADAVELAKGLTSAEDKAAANTAYKARKAELSPVVSPDGVLPVTLADALLAVKSGELDMARDIARSLTQEDAQEVFGAIDEATGQ